MYLSRVEINVVRRGAQQLMSSPQAMHAAVMTSFHEQEPAGRVLWRVDGSSHTAQLYVLSAGMPDFTALLEQAGWPTTQRWQSRDYDELLATLSGGKQVYFRLTANPTRSLRRESGGRGQRLGHVTADQQRDWLLQRAERWGFQVARSSGEPDVQVTERRVLRFTKERGARTVTLTVAAYQGHLVVTDAAVLRRALTEGMGRAKAYGCGLMTLAPPAVR